MELFEIHRYYDTWKGWAEEFRKAYHMENEWEDESHAERSCYAPNQRWHFILDKKRQDKFVELAKKAVVLGEKLHLNVTIQLVDVQGAMGYIELVGEFIQVNGRKHMLEDLKEMVQEAWFVQIQQKDGLISIQFNYKIYDAYLLFSQDKTPEA